MSKDKHKHGKGQKPDKSEKLAQLAASEKGTQFDKDDRFSYKGEFGKITGSKNGENEFKVGFFFTGEQGSIRIPRPKGSEKRIISVGTEIYNAYLEHRYAYESKQHVSPDTVILADNDEEESDHQEQNKESRTRVFYIMGQDHPYDLEIRVEDKDGERIMMLKKGNGANSENPVVGRKELKLVGDIREEPEIMLRRLPKEYQEEMGFDFAEDNHLYAALETKSKRKKSKVRLVERTILGPLDFVLEPAYDAGSGRILIPKNDIPPHLLEYLQELLVRWPIREFEEEVKGIYRPKDHPNHKLDIKKHPEAENLTASLIAEWSTAVLRAEREDFIEFAQLFLLERARQDPDRYGDIEVAGIYDSKSKPGRRLLEAWEKKTGQTVRDVVTGQKPVLIDVAAHPLERIPGIAA